MGWCGELHDADGSILRLVTSVRSPPFLGDRSEASRFQLARLGVPARRPSLGDGGARLGHPHVRVSRGGRSAVSDHGGEAWLPLADGGALAVRAVSHLADRQAAVWNGSDDHQLRALRVA